MNGGILGVEVVEIFLGEGLLGTVPHQVGHPGNEDVAERVGVDGVNLRILLDVVRLFGHAGFEVNVVEISTGGPELGFRIG